MNTDALKKYLARVKSATQARSAEVRLPLAEANEVSIVIAELLVQALEKKEQPAPVTDMVIDGGNRAK